MSELIPNPVIDEEDHRNLSQDDSEEFGETAFFQPGTSPEDNPLPMEASDARTPPRVMSSNSLVGEYFVNSTHHPLSGKDDGDLLFSPTLLSPSESYTSPSEHYTTKMSLSPPPLHQSENMSFSPINSQKRPPRAPSASLRIGGGSVGGVPPLQQQSRGNFHTRVNSSGDSSILSALTDISFDLPKSSSLPQPNSRISSHWDHTENPDVNGMDIDVPASLQQPVLKEEVPISSYLSTSQTDQSKSQSSGHGPSQSTTSYHEGQESLRQMAEHESEAERLLIRALEEDRAQGKQKEVGILFANINPENVDRFVPRTKMTSPPRSPKPVNDIGIRNEQEQEVGHSLHQQRKHSLTDVAAKLFTIQNHGLTTHPSKKFMIDDNADLRKSESSTDRLVVAATLLRAAVKFKGKITTNKIDGDNIIESSTTEVNPKESTYPLDEPNNIDDIETGNAKKLPFRKFASKVTELTFNVKDTVIKTTSEGTKAFKEEWDMFGDFVKPKRASFKEHTRNVLLFSILPSFCIALLLFYAASNPPTGKASDLGFNTSEPMNTPSISWWILFIGVRQVLMFSLARVSESIIVDYLVLSSPRFMRLVGPSFGLLISQSSGWPCVLTIFGLLDMLFLYGKGAFPSHWLYWQDWFSIFNEENPAGNVVSREIYLRFLISFVFLGVTTSAKRLLIGMYFGKRLILQYRAQLSTVLQQVTVLAEISLLVKSNRPKNAAVPGSSLASTTNDGISASKDVQDASIKQVDSREGVPWGISKLDILEMLDHWEEPRRVSDESIYEDSISIKDILQFRQACLLMQAQFPFSHAFGDASNRKSCLRSAQSLYYKLLGQQSDMANTLNFDVLCRVFTDNVTGKKRLEDIKEEIKLLVKIFRPDNLGQLSLLDFVRGVDEVYKNMVFLASSISNSSQIDRAYEKILTLAFYTVTFFLILGILGISALTCLLGLSSVLISLAFMIGPASSAYFEGVLLILLRKPYDIGDRIALSPIDTVVDTMGSQQWIVEKCDLFTTTMRLVGSREVATVSNGSIARTRIMNMNRSDFALVNISLNFGVDNPYRKVKAFHSALEKFVKDRPNEWVAMVSFRSTSLQADLGYIEYLVVLKHRESWQRIADVLESKARVASFCLELQKQLNMQYRSPLPVALNIKSNETSAGTMAGSTSQDEKPFTESPNYDVKIRALDALFEDKKSK